MDYRPLTPQHRCLPTTRIYFLPRFQVAIQLATFYMETKLPGINSQIFQFKKTHSKITIDIKESQRLEAEILSTVAADSKLIRTPITRILRVEDGGVIECVAIPSPGSPYRNLIDFGYNGNNSHLFIEEYLASTFNWLMSE